MGELKLVRVSFDGNNHVYALGDGSQEQVWLKDKNGDGQIDLEIDEIQIRGQGIMSQDELSKKQNEYKEVGQSFITSFRKELPTLVDTASKLLKGAKEKKTSTDLCGDGKFTTIKEKFNLDPEKSGFLSVTSIDYNNDHKSDQVNFVTSNNIHVVIRSIEQKGPWAKCIVNQNRAGVEEYLKFFDK